MTRIGVKGMIASGVQSVGHVEVPSIPVLDWLFSQIHNAVNGQLDDTNMAAKGITAASIADATITAAKIAAGTLTSALMADGVGQTYSGSYTGDGNTANRTISIGFTPRWVMVIRTDATFVEFLSIANGGTSTNWYRDVTGAMAALTTNWQGIVAGGFKLGSSATGTSNVNAVVYQVVAWK